MGWGAAHEGVNRSRLSPTAIAVLIGVVAFVFRFLTSGAIENDHFIMLARAYQVLHGDWPVRDFEDPGQPLAYLVSTAAAAAFGPTLLVNVALSILFLSVTAAMTYVLALRATGSTLAAIAAAVITIVIPPRMYNTTKIVVPVVAIWLAWRYDDVPTMPWLAALAGWTAVAFLLRHDYAVYTTVSAALLLAIRHAQNRREMLMRLAMFGVLSLLLASPWLLYVQWFEGIPAYFAAALRFTEAEGQRTADWAPSALFFAMTAIPVTGLLVSPHRGPRLTGVQIASASILVLLIDIAFLRDVVRARIPDVIAPTVVVIAAVAGHLLSSRGVTRSALVLLSAGVLWTVVPVMQHRTVPPGLATAARRAIQVTRRLASASPDIQPDPTLAPLIAYLQRCTLPSHRVLVSGFGPEIPVLAHRPFAGGLSSWIPGYYESAADVSRALERLNREQVGAAVMLDGSAVFVRSWPGLGQWIEGHHFQEHAVPAINPRIRVWLPGFPPNAPVDGPTGLPCRSQ